MMQLVVPRSWKDEFAFAAAAKREDLLHKERMAWLKDREHQRRKEDREDGERYDAETWAMIEAVLATPQEIAAFRLQLDEYDAATVDALMDNGGALEAIRARIDAMLGEAHVLPDGRRVFKTEDGQRVFDEYGVELSPEIIDPLTIDDRKPRWEAFKAEKETEIRLEEEREQLLDYQAKLDEARERLDSGEITKDELKRIETDLAADMPDAVREKLGLEKPVTDVALKQEATATHADVKTPLPSNMDDLMRQTGFASAPGAGL